MTQRVGGVKRLGHAKSSSSEQRLTDATELDRTTKRRANIEGVPPEEDKPRSRASQLGAGQSRRHDISVFRIEKIVRKGRGKDRFNGYWYAAWVRCGISRNVYLGNCDKISMEEALEKAKRIKAADLKLEGLTA